MVERRDGAAGAIHRQTGEPGALHREAQQVDLREDVEHQPAVLEVVRGEGERVGGVHAPDLGQRIAARRDLLAAPEQLLRHGLEREALEVAASPT